MDFDVIFVTGLTTGGLTCLAVQGGLLATALVRPVVTEVDRKTPAGSRKAIHAARSKISELRKRKVEQTGLQLPNNPIPIFTFLVAKLVAYTILGFFLGLIGSAAKLSPNVQALMQILVGFFMIATALNMLNVHPIFRYFTIQPPKRFTRFVRGRAKSQDVFAPLVLGLLTILIPCGTTQAMMVLAVSTGSALTGAAVMFVFILGTSPTFFVLGFLASQARGQFQKVLAIATAILVLILGFLSIDTGMNLLGSPYAPTRLIASLLRVDDSAYAANPEMVAGVQEFVITASGRGYSPSYLNAKSNAPIRLRFRTSENYSCSSILVIPALKIERTLPPSGETVVDLPAQSPGKLRFSCGMGMYTGVITITG